MAAGAAKVEVKTSPRVENRRIEAIRASGVGAPRAKARIARVVGETRFSAEEPKRRVLGENVRSAQQLPLAESELERAHQDPTFPQKIGVLRRVLHRML